MKEVKLIWAQSLNRAIGKDGDIPWVLPEDLKRFQELTKNSTVIMGRNTWVSLPEHARPLKGRRNLVITSSEGLFEHAGAECYSNLEEAIKSSQNTVWVIGGARMYADSLQYATLLEITLINSTIEDADTFAPLIPQDFIREEVVPSSSDEWLVSKNGTQYKYETWVRK